MTISTYRLPDISSIYKYNFNIAWESKEYEIILNNNTRTEDITMDITTTDENSNIIYIIKNAVLSQNINLMNLVNSNYWSGFIYIYEYNGKDIPITPYNLNTNFFMALITEDEL